MTRALLGRKSKVVILDGPIHVKAGMDTICISFAFGEGGGGKIRVPDKTFPATRTGTIRSVRIEYDIETLEGETMELLYV